MYKVTYNNIKMHMRMRYSDDGIISSLTLKCTYIAVRVDRNRCCEWLNFVTQ